MREDGGRFAVGLRRHRWWLALVALLLTPWPGPHVDSYLPLAGVLLRAVGEKPDAAFWGLAAVVIAVGYAIWFGLLTGAAAIAARNRGGTE